MPRRGRSRVFPTPPGPVRVTRRWSSSRSSSMIARRSSSRPIVGVGGAGNRLTEGLGASGASRPGSWVRIAGSSSLSAGVGSRPARRSVSRERRGRRPVPRPGARRGRGPAPIGGASAHAADGPPRAPPARRPAPCAFRRRGQRRSGPLSNGESKLLEPPISPARTTRCEFRKRRAARQLEGRSQLLGGPPAVVRCQSLRPRSARRWQRSRSSSTCSTWRTAVRLRFQPCGSSRSPAPPPTCIL